MPNAPDVLIVGAGAAGLSVAEGLRETGFSGSITILGDEGRTPYARPPLSKQVLSGAWPPDRTAMLDPPSLDALGVTLVSACPVIGLNHVAHEVKTRRGSISYGELVIATGARARMLPAQVDPRGVSQVLRTVDDSVRLRERLADQQSVVIVGTGVLASEIAAVARAQECDTTIAGRSRRFRLGPAGWAFDANVMRLHREHGVTLHMGEQIVGVDQTSAGIGIQLSSGKHLSAGVLVAAIGSRPNIEWLLDTGIPLADGVVCDETGLCAPSAYAVGDCAQWQDARSGVGMRDELHLTVIQQGRAVARRIASGDSSPAIEPYFWTELYGSRFQASGRFPGTNSARLLHGSFQSDGFVGASHVNGETTGLFALNMPKEFLRARHDFPLGAARSNATNQGESQR